MASLPIKSFSAIVQAVAAGMQGRASAVLDFSVGSTLRALAEAVGGVALWLQGLILQVLLTTRAATSSEADLDSWMNDFGVIRLTATPASGLVAFSRFTATAQGFIPVGAQVRTADLTQTYTVVADAANSAYSAGQGGYVLPVGLATLAVPVQANVASAASNAAAGSIAIIATALPGVDTVVNAGDFTNGADAETDEQFRARFPLFIASLSKATTLAILYAVRSLQLGLQATVTENQNYDGSAHPGSFYVVVDDGSGTPPSSIITQVSGAIELVRPLGVTYAVFPPQIVNASIAISLAVAPGYDRNTVIGVVDNAVQTYVNTLPLGAPLAYLKIAQVALNASPGVANVVSLTLNGAQGGDLAISAKQVAKISTLTVV